MSASPVVEAPIAARDKENRMMLWSSGFGLGLACGVMFMILVDLIIYFTAIAGRH